MATRKKETGPGTEPKATRARGPRKPKGADFDATDYADFNDMNEMRIREEKAKGETADEERLVRLITLRKKLSPLINPPSGAKTEATADGMGAAGSAAAKT